MEKKQFNLSEKITAMFNEAPLYAGAGWRTETRDKLDIIIKEFIKRLKEELPVLIVWKGKPILKIINKLAGDKLC